MKIHTQNKRLFYTFAFFILIITEILIALFIHDNFIRPYVGDMLVVILIYCFVRIFIPDKLKLLPLYVFIFALVIEISQYFNLIDVLGLSESYLAHCIFGSSFDFKDILCYALGCIICVIFSNKTIMQVTNINAR